uniref:DUF1902 domain-containing protein n=1 Tax=Candidatus Kentrum sp. FW TaxID=2126338 RepID=A0A450U4A4_9GAMM|nr:MAG: hypothetical protein BECKFW1821C_GA0114237_11717 [Candidatus Kentron sp. FW]
MNAVNPDISLSELGFRQSGKEKKMERFLNIHIERLPEGVYLATSDSIQGLVAQGRTVAETLEIARDVARKLIEAQEQKQAVFELPMVNENFDYPLAIEV